MTDIHNTAETVVADAEAEQEVMRIETEGKSRRKRKRKGKGKGKGKGRGFKLQRTNTPAESPGDRLHTAQPNAAITLCPKSAKPCRIANLLV